MWIKFLEDGESPDIGAYKKGDEREMLTGIGNIFIQRGIAEEMKSKKQLQPITKQPKNIVVNSQN